MSQIGSSSGVRVAAQPLSNVYTVLLLIGAVALILALVLLAVVMDRNYGAVMGEENMKAVDQAAAQQQRRRAELDEVDESLKRFPEGISPAAGTAPPDTGAGTGTDTGTGTGAGAAPETGEATTPPAGTEPAPEAGTETPAGN